MFTFVAVWLPMVADMQSGGTGGSGEPEEFMEVWDRNLEEAFVKIRQIIESYPYVGMVSAAMAVTSLARRGVSMYPSWEYRTQSSLESWPSL